MGLGLHSDALAVRVQLHWVISLAGALAGPAYAHLSPFCLKKQVTHKTCSTAACPR